MKITTSPETYSYPPPMRGTQSSSWRMCGGRMNRSGRQRSLNTRSSNTGRRCELRFYDLRLCATDELLRRSCVGRTRGMFAECSCYLPCWHCARAHTVPRGASGSPSFKSRKILSEGDGHYGFRLPLPDCRAAFVVHYVSAVLSIRGPKINALRRSSQGTIVLNCSKRP